MGPSFGVVFSLVFVFMSTLALVLGAGYRMRRQRREVEEYMRAHDAFYEVRRQLKLQHFIDLRMMRKDLREGVRIWREDKTPFEDPKSEKLKREVQRFNAAIRQRPEVLVSILKATLHQASGGRGKLSVEKKARA